VTATAADADAAQAVRMICLDTNAVIAVLNSRVSPVRSRIVTALNQKLSLSISSIVLFELAPPGARIRSATCSGSPTF
jgi:hypothetical protein